MKHVRNNCQVPYLIRCMQLLSLGLLCLASDARNFISLASFCFATDARNLLSLALSCLATENAWLVSPRLVTVVGVFVYSFAL